MTVPAAMLTEYANNPTRIAHALRLTQRQAGDSAVATGDVFGFTEHDEPVTIGGVTYEDDQGLTATSIITSVGTDVGNLEITTLNDESLFTFADITGGLWNNADFLIFRYNWATPPSSMSDVHGLMAGTISQISIEGPILKIELRDVRQAIQQDIGNASIKTCRYRLGSTSVATGGFCMKDVSSSPFTRTATVTTAGQQTFTASGRTEVADYFGDGELEWLTGANTGQLVKIKSFASGVFTLVRPMFGTVVNGDTARVVVGCRKRFDEDCVGKFANGLNHGGEKDRRGLNNLTASPE